MAHSGSEFADDHLDKQLSETSENLGDDFGDKSDEGGAGDSGQSNSVAETKPKVSGGTGDSTQSNSVVETKPKVSGGADINVFQTRPRRTTKLSLEAKESKTTELELRITKTITLEYKTLSKIQSSIQTCDIDVLYSNLDILSERMIPVIQLYRNLVAIHEDNENKIKEKLRNTYYQFHAQATTLRKCIDKKLDDLEAELESRQQQEIAEMEQELEEEARRFQELMGAIDQVMPGQEETTLTHQTATPTNHTEVEIIAPAQSPSHSMSQSEPHRDTNDPNAIGLFAERFADKLAAEIRPARKSVEPEVFSGDCLKFNEWEIDLEAYYKDERLETSREQLRHMKKFLSGEARKCVESYFILNSDASYQEARKTLKERYGNQHNIVRGLRTQLENWKPIGPKDRKGLREFSDFLHSLQAGMRNMEGLKVLDDYHENEKMVKKLPEWLRLRWTRIVAAQQERESRYPKFREFCTFVKNEADIMALPISISMTKSQPMKENHTMSSYATGSCDKDPCLYCKLTNHGTHDCYRLKEKSKQETNDFCKAHGLCFRCFVASHRSQACQEKLVCLVCRKAHATANHDENYNPRNRNPKKPEIATPPPQPPTQDTKTAMATTTGNSLVTMAIPVKVYSGSRSVMVYALLDSMSDSCYATPALISSLKLEATSIEKGITLHTMNGPEVVDLKRYDDIKLQGYMNDSVTSISAYARDIYCNRSQLPSPSKARKYHHLRSISEEMPPYLDIPVGLLIGMNHPEILQPIETRPAPPGMNGAPFGVKTLFGWTMGGGTENTRNNKSTCKTDVNKDTRLLEILEKDFSDVGKLDGYQSQEDLLFDSILNSATTRSEEGNYVMPLPLKKDPFLPNNRDQAEKRLHSLLKRFQGDPAYRTEYTVFIKKIIDSGHAELASESSPEGRTWYIPHFSVRHKQKGKLRVVFDASAQYKGTALNDHLLTGPDHMNSLIGILLRFRKEPIAVTCDIQQMFFNFVVSPEHRDFLRFLWIDDSDRVIDYRMKVHLFGAKSSPAVATFGLRKAAKDYSGISKCASEFLMNDFYVDDGVTSVRTTDEARSLITAATEICAKANIRLHKFLSNDKETLLSVPESERGESAQGLDLFQDNLPSERTLGMKWDMESDTFYFNEPANVGNPPTKRIMLSTIAQIYDPMGLISPVILQGKRLLQNVSASDLPWDQLLDPAEALEWNSWVNQLPGLVKLSLNRCIKPPGQVVTTELHHFSDASLSGYAACSYVRQVNSQGVVTCNLVLSKARVAPLNKPTTIPRLELQGAVTATRLAATIRREIRTDITQEFFWTDSEIVLGYIRNDARKFHMFVANRVKEIRQSTSSSQWNHVATEDNPADLASRGCSAEALLVSRDWFNGPAFLNQASLDSYLSNNQTNPMINENDPEVRSNTLMAMATTGERSLVKKFERYSKWASLVRSIAILKGCLQRKKWIYQKPTSENLQAAELQIVRLVQQSHFSTDKEKKAITNLTPTDHDGLLRVGGRLGKADHMDIRIKHPVIVPKNSHIATLIGRHYHNAMFHLGYRSTVGAMREAGFWVVNSTTLVKRVIAECITCARLRKAPQSQQMGQLPKERIEVAPPFTHIGLDAFGPFYVRERRTEFKRWGLMVSCLYSRAIHIELLEDMTADSVIQALRCVMALRGPISSIISDNGTNFVGAKKELENHWPGLTTWRLNPPMASHQGGATERMIRSARAVLSAMGLKYKGRMDTKTLRTIFLEAANIINSRPLTGSNLNTPDQHIITPNLLLHMKNCTGEAPAEFREDHAYGVKRWKVAQAIVAEFSKCWKTEYLGEISQRQKWTKERENIKVGDIVMLIDNQAARCNWKIGRIITVYPGADGLVRQVEVKTANRLDNKGLVIEEGSTMRRPITKLVVLVKQE